jgi:hypothetical protein
MRSNNTNPIDSIKHSPIHNYVIPGLTSWLIQQFDDHCVRMFEMTRHHEENITPHSHRFDFFCWVLEGTVHNVIWEQSFEESDDVYALSTLRYNGNIGEYTKTLTNIQSMKKKRFTFHKGESYGMKHHQIHSIFFEKGTKVLFFEGKSVTDSTNVIEPVVDRRIIPTFKVEPWMFKKG